MSSTLGPERSADQLYRWGSYFGSELCPVDINVDGTTDLSLVAAPFYHARGEEGRVYVYRLNEPPSSWVC
ncbi:hypothetical protein P7K49_010272 [Saguinus oedipus]|uniref:Uncharacterized protein n=1 Tax=Saguinus oedipus TaxID=9490 RepID=A0ABQ9VN22_SAGOE|nr:hypothetical protein P7K49_010272 [Saguinus oedipus]